MKTFLSQNIVFTSGISRRGSGLTPPVWSLLGPRLEARSLKNTRRTKVFLMILKNYDPWWQKTSILRRTLPLMTILSLENPIPADIFTFTSKIKAVCKILVLHISQGVTNICRLSWLTNSALIYEPKGEEGGNCRISANEDNGTQEPK